MKKGLGLFWAIWLLGCVIAQAAPAFQTPCIDAPYDYAYLTQDEQILIRSFQTDTAFYYIADVQLTDPMQFQTLLSAGKPSASVCGQSSSVLAVSASHYGSDRYGIIIRNGVLLRANSTTRSVLAIDANGDFTVYDGRSIEDPERFSEQLLARGVWQTFVSSPELVRDGLPAAFRSEEDTAGSDVPTAEHRQPCIGIGQIGPLHYLLIVADGRQDGYSEGLTLSELRQLFLDHHAQTAITLSDGASAEICFNGTEINQPFEHERPKTSDVLFF